MKMLKTGLAAMMAGLLIGLWLGVNIGREKPLLSNPFDKEALEQKIRQVSGETLEKGGKALESTGQALQDRQGK